MPVHVPADAGTAEEARPTYRERLWPGPLGWTCAPAAAVVAAITFVPVDVVAAAVAGAVTLGAALAAAVAASPVVEVFDGHLRAGRARIPVAVLHAPRALDREGVARALGPGSDARAFACLRAWVPGAVEVAVRDPEDPTPAWLISSRRPDELTAALLAAGAQAAHSEQIG